ncbi:CocE/NonD family hydrolase [Pontimicrobium aquaticum]|uniref:CocE/NonD family hydrolase n=1 Tax=Pontimicrobium aquaticum TaxID=2565367 RepID=A0A4U0F2K9_9FLAO|nr:CocE/NonD family hydrolase [Pontimicrobium aquaticum]TJY38014.1 CocE/NonD family hydrolase [Pontimicrobium aquaticum]
MKTIPIYIMGFLMLTITSIGSCQTTESFQKPRTVEKEGKQYLVQDSVLITTRDGAKIATIIVRDKNIKTPQTAILFHTVYTRKTDINRAIKAANNGYVGVVSYTRGKGLSPDEIIPYEHESNDVYDVIDWISKQSWNNGEVGMYGGSYVGFVQWAAAKKLHPALKTIVPSATAAPGIAEPMENGVIPHFFYPWPHYVSTNKYLNNELYNDGKRWGNLYQEQYEKGTAYRSMDSLDGLDNPIFRKWLDHPTYDAYWQNMMPYKEDFAQIDIPVLTTTGYYDGGQIGAMHYLKEHYKYNKNAENYLVIGPYTHFGSQSIPDKEVGGYAIDEVAQINITNLIFDWFDYIFKEAPKPELLKDKINYQIMSANTWGHASSINNMSNHTLKYYFNNKPSGVVFKSTFDSGNNGSNQHFSFTEGKPEVLEYLEQEVDFSDRAPEAQHNYFTPFTINETLTVGNGFSFITPAFEEDVELNGSFFGELKIAINKKDMDCSMLLYEQTPEGKYFKLTLRYVGRASHAKNIETRHLLKPNEITSFPFTNVRMTSKKLRKGSRLVIVLNVNKHAYEQLNYGTGKDVSDETIADAKEPLIVKWYNDSFIKFPIKK